MQRRDVTLGLFAAVAAGSAHAQAGKSQTATEAGVHDGHHGRAVGRYASLVHAFDQCAAAATECVAHCQKRLADGDKMMGECLKSSLACDAICPSVARLARLDSDHLPAIAKASIAVMQACADACQPHIEHHAFCKICFEACGVAIAAAKAV